VLMVLASMQKSSGGSLSNPDAIPIAALHAKVRDSWP
jgi:hypothetical protein